MANPIVSSLPAYVDEKRLPLIAEAVLGAKSAKLFNLQADIKHAAALNLLSTDVVFGDGSTCGWAEEGTQSLTQRILTVGNIKVNMSYCDRDMLAKWMSYEVKTAAGNEALPFEEEFTTEVVKAVQAAVEKAIYQGDTTSTNPNLKYFDGLIKILNAEAGVVDVNASAENAVLANLRKIYNAIPEGAFTRGDVAILVGNDVFRMLVGEMVDANLYHYNPGTPEDEVYLPGTNVRVIGVNGLNGTNKVIAASLRNLFFGTDMMNDMEQFRFFYDEKEELHCFRIRFNAGVQVAFPDEVVLATLA